MKHPLEARPAHWLLASIAITLAPHFAHLPYWVSAFCVPLLLWQGWRLRRATSTLPRRPPSRWPVLLLALGSSVAMKLHFGYFFGMDPGIAFLATLLCLKQLEGDSERDIRAAILLSYFLQLGLFMYYQTIPVALVAMLGVWVSTTTLYSLSDPHPPASTQLRASGLMMLQALPLLLVLFIAFPRVDGPLWGLPSDAYAGRTGLSDSMEPGSISNLSESSEIAFRAEFDGPPPPPALRYWRGPVLTLFDGRTWRPMPAPFYPDPPYEPQGRRYDYRLTLEPHNRNWLLAMDFPGGGTERAQHAASYQLLSMVPVHSRRRLELSAYPETRVGLDEQAAVLRANRQLPAGSNPRTRDEIAQLFPDSLPAEEKLARILERLRELPLIYTLQPPRLGTHSVDEFLFDTHRGFCEHFSSAFVFMMRAAGVPARVVTGYQGGEINPVDGILVVRQSDAHAWAEVWLEGRGWVRVDPTALAAPARIEEGLAASLPEGEFGSFMMRPGFEWLRDMRYQWEAVSNAWNQWVLGYTPERQRELLERLGVRNPDWRSLSILMGLGAAGVMLGLLFWALFQRSRLDPLERAWQHFCRKMRRHGLPRLQWEGPIEYADRAARALPEQADTIRAIAARYARLRYASRQAPDARQLRALEQRIRMFRPR